MVRANTALSLLLPALVACASAPRTADEAPVRSLASQVSDEEETLRPSGATTAAQVDEAGDAQLAAPIEASFGASTSAPPQEKSAEPSAGFITAAELRLWRSPEFKRRFAESYLAETDIEPRVTATEREMMLEILDHVSAERTDKALALIAKNRTEASSAVLDFFVANIRFQQEDYERAAKAYEVAVDKYPKFRRAWLNLGFSRMQLGRFDGAIEAFTRVIELGGGDARTYGLLGIADVSVGNWMSAESAFRMATLLDPRALDWKMGLAESLFRQERFADTAALAGQLLADDPSNEKLWLLQANAFARMGNAMRAAENLELVDRMGKGSVKGLNLLGDIYTNEQLFDLAAGAYVRALEADPAQAPTRAIRAARDLTARNALAESKLLVGVIMDLHGERLDDEAKKELLRLRARVAVAEGAGDEEARVLEEIVKLDPLDGEALILLGQHAARSGDVERGIFYYERAASLEAFEADAKVRHAQLLVSQSRYAEALPLLRRAQTLNPRDNVQTYLDQVERVAQAR
jgi:tetratricopeptide (TPR) repeat protein